MSIRVSALGFSESELRSLNTAFSNRAKDRVELCDRSQASVYLVDVDAIGGIDNLKELKLNLENTIAISKTNLPEFEHQLQKPLGFTTLLKAIERAFGYSFTKDKKKESKKDAEVVALSSNKTEPLHPLLNQLKNDILELGRNTKDCIAKRYFFTEGKWLELDFFFGAAFSNIKERSLMSLLWASNDAFLRTETITDKLQSTRLKQSEQIQTSMLLERLLWETTGHGSNSCLLRDIDYHREYQLIRWPDLPKIQFDSSVFPIISYWTKNSSSITELWKRFPANTKIITKLANQCAVSGLLVAISKEQVKAEPKPSTSASKLRQVFGLIVSKLSQGAA